MYKFVDFLPSLFVIVVHIVSCYLSLQYYRFLPVCLLFFFLFPFDIMTLYVSTWKKCLPKPTLLKYVIAPNNVLYDYTTFQIKILNLLSCKLVELNYDQNIRLVITQASQLITLYLTDGESVP